MFAASSHSIGNGGLSLVEPSTWLDSADKGAKFAVSTITRAVASTLNIAPELGNWVQGKGTYETIKTEDVLRSFDDNLGYYYAKNRGSIDVVGDIVGMMAPGIEKAKSRLLTNLQSRGIPVGADAFNDAYGEQQRQTQDTLSRLAMDADIGAGQEQSRLFGLDSAARQGAISELVAAMGGGYNPPSSTPSGNAAGVNYSGMVGQKYQADMNAFNAAQQNRTQTASALGSLGGAMLMKSDRRLKADVRRVGRKAGLNVYEFRYLWDDNGTVRRGFMAQEVLNLFPQAVRWLASGFMAVDYSQLPQVE
jgi:hypothetical protein